MPVLFGVEDELERLDIVLKASEDWSDEYRKDSLTHGKIIKLEAKLERALRDYFKGLSERANTWINWYAYNTTLREVAAAEDDYRIDVIVTDTPMDGEDGIFINVVYDPLAAATAVGAEFGEVIYKIPLGLTDTSASIQKVARQQIADLVGKRLDPNGNMIDNPKAKYRISDKTRQDVRESIRTSLHLGEDQATATARLIKTIRDPKRAAKIASTEAVNAYQGGLHLYAKTSGAVKKEWQTIIGACLLCITNAKAGAIPINDLFPSGHKQPSCHPWDRCAVRYLYPEELNINANV